VTIHLCGLPEGVHDISRCHGRTSRPCSLLGLAPGGVYRADDVTVAAGALLPHRFTLTCDRLPGPSAVSLCCTYPSGRPNLALASTLLCGVPTFLDDAARIAAVTRPPHYRNIESKVSPSDRGQTRVLVNFYRRHVGKSSRERNGQCVISRLVRARCRCRSLLLASAGRKNCEFRFRQGRQ
jgi:hypothetical protein